MSEESEAGTQTLDSSSETIALRLRQETEIEPTTEKTSIDEVTLRSRDKNIKQVTEPILRKVQEMCVLLASRNETESARNNEASRSRRNRESSSPSSNRYNTRSGPDMKRSQN